MRYSGISSSELPPVKVALLGLGRMGRLHAATLARSPSFDVVAVADVVEAARQAAVEQLPGATAYAAGAAALEHQGVEACVVVTPTDTHPPIVEHALQLGLHVLCEKPLALDTDEGLRLARLAADAGRVLQVGFWRRFAPPWAAARDVLVARGIGQPVMVRLSQWDAFAPPAQFCDPARSGGLAIDCGVHEFDLAEWLTGEKVSRVRAVAGRLVDPALGEVGDVDNLVAVLELDGGTVAVVDLSRNARYGDDIRTEVLGAEGALFVETLPEARTRLATADGVTTVSRSEAHDVLASGLLAQAEAFAAAVRGGAAEVPDAMASVRATAIGWAVSEAARTGEVVSLTDPGAVGGGSHRA